MRSVVSREGQTQHPQGSQQGNAASLTEEWNFKLDSFVLESRMSKCPCSSGHLSARSHVVGTQRPSAASPRPELLRRPLDSCPACSEKGPAVETVLNLNREKQRWTNATLPFWGQRVTWKLCWILGQAVGVPAEGARTGAGWGRSSHMGVGVLTSRCWKECEGTRQSLRQRVQPEQSHPRGRDLRGGCRADAQGPLGTCSPLSSATKTAAQPPRAVPEASAAPAPQSPQESMADG